MKVRMTQNKYKRTLILFVLFFIAIHANAQNTLDNIGLTSSTPASVAYSLRQLSTSYTGPLVRIKVGALFYDVYPDATTKIFSLSSKISASMSTYNALVSVASASTLSSIITGSTDATVAIWYDQSGNVVHVLSSSAAANIITAGNINTIRGQPTIYFNGSTSYLVSSKTVNYSSQTNATVNVVAQNIASVSQVSGIISTGNNGGWGLCYDPSTGIQGYWIDGSGNYGASTLENTTIPKVITGLMGGGISSKIYSNGILKGTRSTPNSNGTTDNIMIGLRGTDQLTRQFVGNVSEAYLFPKNLSSSEQTALESSQSIFIQPIVTITSSATSSTCAGTNITFTSNIINFTNTPTYQWYKNGTAISGATASTYSTTSINTNDQVYVTASTSSAGSIPSSGLLFNLDASNSSSYSGSGSTWNDISGNNNNTTLYNTPTYSSTNGGSLVFNGSNQYGLTPNTISSFSQGTFIAWIKRNGSQGLSTAGYVAVIYSRYGGVPIGLNIVNNYLALTWNSVDYKFTLEGLLIPDNTWCMVAISASTSDTRAYLFQPSGLISASIGAQSIGSYPAQFKIGVDDCCARYFNGNIGQALTYNTALTSAQIQSIYNSSATRFGLSPIGTTYNSNTITTTLSPAPTVNVTVNGDSCVNKTSLTATAGLSSYAWLKDNVLISGATSSTYSPSASGVYQIQVSNGTCSNTSTATTIYTCGITADGKMSTVNESINMVSREGAINSGNGVDERGLIITKPFTAPAIVTSGLLLNLDAANPASYPGSGITWTNLASGGSSLVPSFTLNNQATFSNNVLTNNISSGTGLAYSTSNSNFGNLSSFTIEMWVKISSTDNIGAGSTLFTQKVVSNPVNMVLTYNYDWGVGIPPNQFTASHHYSGWQNFISSSGITQSEVINNWIQIVETFDNSTKTFTIYKNGTSIASGLSTSLTPMSSGSEYEIGSYWGGRTSGRVYGDYSIVNMYNRAISSSEITTNYNAVKSRFGL